MLHPILRSGALCIIICLANGSASAGSVHPDSLCFAPQLYGIPDDITVSCSTIPEIPSFCDLLPAGGTYLSGADAIVANGVGNLAQVYGAPDGIGAELWDDGDQLQLFFSSPLPAGTEVCITLRRRAYVSACGSNVAYLYISEEVGGLVSHTYTFAEGTGIWQELCFTTENSVTSLILEHRQSCADFEIDAIRIGSTSACDAEDIIILYDLQQPSGSPGLRYSYTDLFSELSNIQSVDDCLFYSTNVLGEDGSGAVPNAQDADRISASTFEQWAFLQFSGFLDIPHAGEYSFCTKSTAGSELFVDGKKVADNDGLHLVAESCGTLFLQPGCHEFVLNYFNGGSPGLLETTWEGPGIVKQFIPDTQFSTECSPSLSGSIPAVSMMETTSSCLGGNFDLVRTWTVSNVCGSYTYNQNISLSDTIPPVLTGLPADTSIMCGEDVPPPALVIAEDNCDDEIPVNFWEDIAADEILRTWTASDNCGNEVSYTQTITIAPAPFPVLLGLPGDTSVECSSLPYPDTVTAVDFFGNPIPVELIEVKGVGCSSVVLRIWLATDACGSTAGGIQIINVWDSIPPVLTGVPADTVLPCGAAIPGPPPVSVEDCYGALDVLFTELPVIDGLLRTWTATDLCGRTSSASQEIILGDCDNPPVTNKDSSIICFESNENIEVLQNDNAGDFPILVSSVEITTGPVFGTAFVESDGKIRYSASTGFAGTDSLSYRVADTQGNFSNTSTVYVEVVSALMIDSIYTIATSGCKIEDGKLIIDLQDAAAGIPPYKVVVNDAFLFGMFDSEPIEIIGLSSLITAHKVMIEDNSGCSITDNGIYTVGQPPFEILGFSSTNVDCATGLGTLIVDLDNSAAGSPDYVVTVDTFGFGPFSSEPIVINLLPNDYSDVAVRDANFCKDFLTISITIDNDSCNTCPRPGEPVSSTFSESQVEVRWEGQIDGTGDYIVEYRQFGTAPWSAVLVPDTFVVLDGLLTCTSYEWRVATICSADTSAFNDNEYFSTACPRNNNEFLQTHVFPNPASEIVHLVAKTTNETDIVIRVFDPTGRLIFMDEAKSSSVFHSSLQTNIFLSGLFLVEWQVAGEVRHERFMVVHE